MVDFKIVPNSAKGIGAAACPFVGINQRMGNYSGLARPRRFSRGFAQKNRIRNTLEVN
jgi:hypothetical protein